MPYIANLQEDNQKMTKKLTHLASNSDEQGKPVVSMRGATNTHETDIKIYTQKYKSNGLREAGSGKTSWLFSTNHRHEVKIRSFDKEQKINPILWQDVLRALEPGDH